MNVDFYFWGTRGTGTEAPYGIRSGYCDNQSGDSILFEFAKELRKLLPHQNFSCEWLQLKGLLENPLSPIFGIKPTKKLLGLLEKLDSLIEFHKTQQKKDVVETNIYFVSSFEEAKRLAETWRS